MWVEFELGGRPHPSPLPEGEGICPPTAYKGLYGQGVGTVTCIRSCAALMGPV